MSVSTSFRIQTLFYWCNDVAPMRHFYSDLIGLDETFFKDDGEAGWLNYHVDGVDIVFMRSSEGLPVETEWAKQPGYLGGTLECHSFIIAVPGDQFKSVIQRLRDAEIPTFDSASSDNQLFIHDPMGMTVELYVA